MANVEIYIEAPTLEDVESWLVGKFGKLNVMGEDEEVKVFHGQLNGDVFPIILQKVVEDGPFVGVWFNSVYAPWEDDIACAREAFSHFQKTVQCDPGDQVKGQDQFFQIDQNGESIISLGN